MESDNVKMTTARIFLSAIILLLLLLGGRGNSLEAGGPLRPFSASLSRPVSVEDLKHSEEYLRNDLGLEEPSKNPAKPLWKRSFENHPILVLFSGFTFLGGIIAFIIISRNQSRMVSSSLEKIRQNEREGQIGPPIPIKTVQLLFRREEEGFRKLPNFPPEKALKKVDDVLGTLRQVLGAGMKDSRLSLYRYVDQKEEFRICGFSRGENFKILSPSNFPPKEVFGLPIRILSPMREEGSKISQQKRWGFPFVSNSGEYCFLLLEMTSGNPPENWSDYVETSMDLLKALVSRKSPLREDASLSTVDAFGSLDYRATMNRLLEEWGRSKKLGIPFSVIALRVEEYENIEQYYGITQIETAWGLLTKSIKEILRPTDWIMRPQKDLLLVQVMESGVQEGIGVMNRIVATLSRYRRSKKLEKGLHYRGVLIYHSPDSKLSLPGFFDQILQTLDGKSDFEGTYFYC